MTIKRCLLALLLAIAIVAPTSSVLSAAQKKAVHVKEYTKKDGTTVAAHDRKAPETKAEKAAEKTCRSRRWSGLW
jgi:hypothetical protein